jgi:broad specificity phosphatase PhoE
VPRAAACRSSRPYNDRHVDTTRIYLVRHGATQLTAENRFSGSVGVELSDEGREQAARLGERLHRGGIDAIYSSALSRAIETANLIGSCCGLQAIPCDALREISHGHWEGLTRAEVEERFPGEYESWEEDPFTYAPAGGETGVAVLARALPALREIVTKHQGQRVLIVSHKATIRILISSVLGFDGRGYRDRLDQAPACLNVLDFRDPVHVRLTLFNDTSHYSERPRLPTANLSKWWDAR